MLTTFIGLDFSGARDAGRHAWISQGQASHSRLEVWDCRPAAELPGSGAAREVCLPALARWISELSDCLIGCDFPFSLPLEVMGFEGWETFVSSFARRFPTPETLRAACRSQEGHERRRQTDRETRAPFAPGNLRLYRQTYYGIRDVLSPLVQAGAVSVLPFQRPGTGRPWLIEICPAVTLRRLSLYGRSYKGPGERQRLERWRLLDRLANLGMQLPAWVRQPALEDDGGDALDSLVALLTAWSVRDALAVDASFASEGYIYAPEGSSGASRVHTARDERPAYTGYTEADHARHSA